MTHTFTQHQHWMVLTELSTGLKQTILAKPEQFKGMTIPQIINFMDRMGVQKCK